MRVDDLAREGYRLPMPGDEIVSLVQHGDRVVIVSRYHLYLAEDVHYGEGKWIVRCLADIPSPV